MSQFAEEMNKNNLEREIRDAKNVICPDKECFLSYHFKNRCTIFLPTNNSLCNIPCETSECKTEIHKEITCPIWLCHETSTTTSPIPPTTSSTPDPSPSPEPTPTPNPEPSPSPSPSPSPNPEPTPNSNVSFAISISMNVVLVLITLCILTWWIRKKILAWKLRNERRQRYNKTISEIYYTYSNNNFFSINQNAIYSLKKCHL